MKATLWIPCYNEGTQDIFRAKESDWGPMPEDGHLLKRTLELLREKIRSGIFEHIIITNDGSTDDTEEGLIQFIRENDLPKDRFRILGNQGRENNQGKTMRFFEVAEYADKKLKTETLVMTDADMVNHGGDTFEKLATSHFIPMQVSFQGEHAGKDIYFFSGTKTSGTRSIHIPTIQTIFRKKGIKDNFFENGYGYGLEILLNKFLEARMVQEVTTLHNKTNTPLFLAPLRKKAHIQGEEIQKMEMLLAEFN